ncbi:MAG: Panacea domain-containing protein [Micromonosporaceae bacterium]
MTLSVHDVAAVLRERLPGVGTKKLHQLLYYCQGHHLATFNKPLFAETISAWDMGPVVGTLWRQEKSGEEAAATAQLTEAQLNTVGYVLSRYGALTGNDLEHLTHSELPWQLADRSRRPGASARIKLDWIREYFSTTGAADGDDDEPSPDPQLVSEWLRGAEARRPTPGRPDSVEAVMARLSVSG